MQFNLRKVKSKVVTEPFKTDIFDERSDIIHGLGSFVKVLHGAVEEPNIEIVKARDLVLKERQLRRLVWIKF